MLDFGAPGAVHEFRIGNQTTSACHLRRGKRQTVDNDVAAKIQEDAPGTNCSRPHKKVGCWRQDATAMQNCDRHRVAKRDSSRSSSLTNLREVSSESRRARAIR